MPEDKMLEMGGMDSMDDISDGDFGDDVAPAELPEGIAKETVTEATTGYWKKPLVGDEVNVHFVGASEFFQ